MHISALIFDGFFAGCVAFSAACGFFDWLLPEKRKASFKDAILRYWYWLTTRDIDSAAANIKAFLFASYFQIFGTHPLGRRLFLVYGSGSLLVLLCMAGLIEDQMNGFLAIIMAAFVGLVISGWVPISAGLYLLATPTVRSLWTIGQILFRMTLCIASVVFCLSISATAGWLAIGLKQIGPYHIHSLGSIGSDLLRSQLRDVPPAAILGTVIAMGLIDAFIIFFLFLIVLVLFLAFPVLFLLSSVLQLILIFLISIVIKDVLKWARKPVAIVLARIFESPQGVITQIGIGLGAIGKSGQMLIKYLMS